MGQTKSIAQSLQSLEVVDLTHRLEEDMPVYPTHSRYHHTLWDSFDTGSVALVCQLIINEHCGTHMDATAHFLREGDPSHQFMDETPVSQFFGRALTMDFSGIDATGLVSLDQVTTWEQANHAIEAGDIVIFRFGWDRHWAPRSVHQTYTQSWPGISGEVAEYLVVKQVKAVGCDTLAIDSSFSSDNPAHYALLGNRINIIENLTNLHRILGESLVFAMPLKVGNGSGSPIRAIAFIEKGVS